MSIIAAVLDRYASGRVGCVGTCRNERLSDIDATIKKSVSEPYRQRYTVVARRREDPYLEEKAEKTETTGYSYLFLYTDEFVRDRVPPGTYLGITVD